MFVETDVFYCTYYYGVMLSYIHSSLLGRVYFPVEKKKITLELRYCKGVIQNCQVNMKEYKYLLKNYYYGVHFTVIS